MLGDVEQAFETVDHEIILLIIVDPVFRPHHPLQIEADTIGAVAIQREFAFAIAGDNSRAIDAQALGLLHQPEFHRVPVEPRQLFERAKLQRPFAATPIGRHIIAERLVGEHRHMAEHIVKDIRLLQIIELVRAANEIAGHETPIGQMIEEHIVRYQPRHRHDLPARRRHQPFVEFGEVRNTWLGQLQHVQPLQELLRSAPRQHGALAREQLVPGGMLLRGISVPTLRDGPIGRGALRGRFEDVTFCVHAPIIA